MKQYLTINNILRTLTLIMLIFYFNYDHMKHIHQIINTFKNIKNG